MIGVSIFKVNFFVMDSSLWNCVCVVRYFPHLKETEMIFRKFEIPIDFIALATKQNHTKMHFLPIPRDTKLISEVVFLSGFGTILSYNKFSSSYRLLSNCGVCVQRLLRYKLECA